MKRIFILATIIIVSCATVKNSPEQLMTTFDYKVQIDRSFPDRIWTKLKNKKPSVKRQSTIANMKSIENPSPSFYQLVLKDNVSKLSSIEVLRKNQNSRLKRTSHPFTSGDSYKFIDSVGVYTVLQNIPHSYLKQVHKNFQWERKQQDSIIKGIPVHLVIGKAKDSRVKAWITSKYPKELSIYNMFCTYGFVLAYEMTTEPKPPFRMEKISVFPTKIKAISNKDFTVPELETEMSLQEVLAYYRKQNQED